MRDGHEHRPSGRAFPLSHDKGALGFSVVEPTRSAKWLNPPDHRYRSEMPHGCRRPLVFSHVVSRHLRRAGSTQTPHRQPRQWVLTPLTPCYPASSHSRLTSDASMDASRSFFSVYKREGLVLAERCIRDGHVVDRALAGPFHFVGRRLSLTALHATRRQFAR